MTHFYNKGIVKNRQSLFICSILSKSVVLLLRRIFLLREGWKRLSFYCGVHETIKDKSGQPDGGLSAGLSKDLVSAGTPQKKS